MSKIECVKKLEAAKRQLETSIILYFSEMDFVSIHTLATAAHGILADLGGKPIFEQCIKPDRLEEYHKIIRKPQNFFKHADRDPVDTLSFKPSLSEALMWEACNMYATLTGEKNNKILFTFHAWFVFNNKELFLTNIIDELQKFETQMPALFLKGRKNYFEQWTLLTSKIPDKIV